MKNIKFETREDYVEALNQLCKPLGKYYSEEKALLNIGYTKTHYGNRTIGLEGFSRILWGLIPLWAGGNTSCLDGNIISGIQSGTNPDSKEYWGSYSDGAQAYVEMASMGLSLLLTPEKTWNPLSAEEKIHFNNWLQQINEHKISDNNWLFFRVLVNCGLKNVNGVYNEAQLEMDLKRIDDFYLGDGWYSDGETKQVDYYIGFAMHFYSLLYAKLMYRIDKKRSAKYIERAKLFARDYIYWFGIRGEALPYGRSLTYRFAQTGFWCALAFTDTEVFSWGIMKGIIGRHFRYWFNQPILDCEDKLTIGYAYPNLTVSEGYNSPNSPYWAFKSFLVLALDEQHPFWKSKEEPLPKLEKIHLLKHPGMIITRGEDGYVTALASGQYAEWEPVHCGEKYGKFAYSSYFGFQSPRSYYNLSQAAPDNMLAFYKDSYYHIRRRCSKVEIDKEKVVSHWSPFHGVEVVTTITPHKNGHKRQHIITSQDPYTAVEGGFALPVDELEEASCDISSRSVTLSSEKAVSKIKLLEGVGVGNSILCEANVNLVHPRTILPYMEYKIEKGTTTITIYIEGGVK